MKDWVLTILFSVFFVFTVSLASDKADSLEALLTNGISDSTRADILDKLTTEALSRRSLTKGEQRIVDSIESRVPELEGYTLHLAHSHLVAILHNFDPFRTMQLMQKAQDWFLSYEYRAEYAESLRYFGLALEHSGDYLGALKYYQKSESVYRELDSIPRVLYLHGHILNIYFSHGNYPEALALSLEDLEILEGVGHSKGIASTINNIGFIYSNLNDKHKALEYYDKALTIAESDSNKPTMGLLLNNIGGTYAELGAYDKALEYCKRGLSIRKELPPGHGKRYMSCLTLADILTEMGKYDQALNYIDSAKQIFAHFQTDYERADVFIQAGIIKERTADYNGARIELDLALDLVERIHNRERQSRIYKILSEVEQAVHQYQQALHYFKRYSGLKDSLFNEDKSKEIGKLEAKHEFEKAEEERKRLEKEKFDVENDRKMRRDNLQYSGILIFLVLLTSGLMAIGKLAIPIRLAEGLIFFTFLLFFEFMLVMLDPYIENYSGGEPAYKLLFNAMLAGLIFPLHSFFESRMKRRLVGKPNP